MEFWMNVQFSKEHSPMALHFSWLQQQQSKLSQHCKNIINYSHKSFSRSKILFHSIIRMIRLKLLIICHCIQIFHHFMWRIFLPVLLLSSIYSSPATDLDTALQAIRDSRSLMGIQLEITKDANVVYHANIGLKDATNPIRNDTLFRVASLSKSFASAAIMLLVEKGQISLNQTISELLGFAVINPFFPESPITLEMILSHQSSLVECDPYYSDFLTATYQARTGLEVPDVKQILGEGGKFYNECLFSSKNEPGTHFLYVNLNFGIAGTVVEKVSGVRFDIFLRDNILKPLSAGLSEIATFNAATIARPSNLGVIFVGSAGKWVPNYDSYPSGVIPERNLTGYKIGSNGVIFGPQGGLRASASHLSNYMIMLSRKGVSKEGIRILSQRSVSQMLKPIYQYHGTSFGSANDFHLYGLGLYTTTYRANDIVIPHQTVRGHLGSAYGLISSYFFWKNYTLTYIINGALNGYGYGTGTIYERQRLLIHQKVIDFIQKSM